MTGIGLSRTFLYVWHPFVEDYLKLGWTFAAHPLIAVDRGGHPSWLMVWTCDCPPRTLKEHKKHAEPSRVTHSS